MLGRRELRNVKRKERNLNEDHKDWEEKEIGESERHLGRRKLCGRVIKDEKKK